MAEYKVPQDVEADDKLIGPFSFRQFIYLIIVAGALALGWVLSQIFLPLAAVVLPIIVLFGALALPLRKDQPMETYLAAVVSYFLKPRKRLWDPDGTDALVEITAPKVVEKERTKNLDEGEAERRLSYLANLVDSRGWSVRGVTQPENSSMNTDVYFEAQQTEDVLDDEGRAAQNFDTILDRANQTRREEMMNRMHQPASAPQPAAAPAISQPVSAPAATTTAADPATDPHLTYNPYPSMQQSIIRPMSEQPAPTPVATPQLPQAEPSSQKPVSTDIMNLANNADLSIETIAHEANRIHEREQLPDNEVTISLR